MKPLLAACALALLPVLAQGAGAAAKVFESAAPSVFSIGVITTSGESRTGSGVAVAQGKVVTNYHVVRGARKIFIKQGAQSSEAVLESSDESHDLALLRNWDLKAPAVNFGAQVAIGQSVFAIGSPRGLELSLSEGLVSSLRNTADGALIQTTAAISPGSSGGGLFDEQGRLVGLTTAQILNGQNLNFAIPVEWLRHVGVQVRVAQNLAAPAAETPTATAAPTVVPPATSAPPEIEAAVEVVAEPAPPANSAQPRELPALAATEEDSAGFSSVYLGFGMIAALLLLAKPAINALTEFMNRDATPSAAATRAAIRAALPDRLLPFRAQAREDIKSNQKDPDTWLRALEQTAGDEPRALAAYIEMRAQALYRADLDRKWKAAQAQAQNGQTRLPG